METGATDVTDGERCDIEGEFVTQRSIDCDGTAVSRLSITDDDGRTRILLVEPGNCVGPSLQSGRKYRFEGVLGSKALADPESDLECPDCGGAVRQGQAVDRVDHAVVQAARTLEIDGAFGIVDDRTSVRQIGSVDSTVDDWQPLAQTDAPIPEFVCDACGGHYEYVRVDPERSHQRGTTHANESPDVIESQMAAPETVGVATGGAKDTDNFRENIREGYTPQPDAISDEGLFYEYYFETGSRTATDSLFAPRYATAVSEHPLSGDVERYVSVGLDSSLSVDDFERPRLDLVAVLDISGSMNSPFEQYYYDEQGRRQEADADETTKREAAVQSLCALTEQLHDNDRLGVVLFNNRAHVAKPLRDVGSTDMAAIRSHIRDVQAGGGTNMADGFEAAAEMLADGDLMESVERRVVFMTDMMPNTGQTGEAELVELFEDAAEEGIHATFLGIGLDENAELADAVSGVRGANHYFVHSADAFEQRLGEEFGYMVTPLAYDLGLELETDDYDVTAVHGSPTDASDGEVMSVSTLFPSAKDDGEARGGVVLVELEPAVSGPDPTVALEASWTERDGTAQTERVTVELPAEPEWYTHDGVRKAVALSRYVSELQDWAREVHERAAGAGIDDWLLDDTSGEHERESVPLAVSDDDAARFTELQEYMATEREVLGDETLEQELDLLETLQEASD